MTAAQRLRLVLALGAINLVLASVAFAVGIVGVQSPPTTAGGPTPGIAFVSPAPTATTTAPEPTPASSPEPGTSTPGTPVPTTTPVAEPTPTAPAASPSVEPSPTVEPTPGAGPHAAARPASVVVLGHPPVASTRQDADTGGRRSPPDTAAPSKHPAKPPQGQASRQEAAQATPPAARRQAGPRPAGGSRQVEPRTQVPAPIAHQSQPALGSRPRADVNGSARSSRRGLHGAIGSSSDEVRAR